MTYSFGFNYTFTRADEQHAQIHENGYEVVAPNQERALELMAEAHAHLTVLSTRLVSIHSEEGDLVWKAPVTDAATEYTVVFTMNALGSPVGKLADAELQFTSGRLAGLRLLGFAVWERRNGPGRNVTFPSRQYSVNGERRSYALLRPITETAASQQLTTLILDAYAAQHGGVTTPETEA